MPEEFEPQSIVISANDIICPECIKTQDPDKVAENEENLENNEPPINTRVITILKSREEYANHILKYHPASQRVNWAKAELEYIKKQSEPKKDEALKTVIKEALNSEPTSQKPPKVNIFKRLLSSIKPKPKVKPVVHRKKKISL
jgi:hypothetical protein